MESDGGLGTCFGVRPQEVTKKPALGRSRERVILIEEKASGGGQQGPVRGVSRGVRALPAVVVIRNSSWDQRIHFSRFLAIRICSQLRESPDKRACEEPLIAAAFLFLTCPGPQGSPVSGSS